MEYTTNEIALAYSPEMMALSAKFDEWFEAEALRVGEGNIYKLRGAFFDLAVQVYGITEAQFERSQDIRLTAVIESSNVR